MLEELAREVRELRVLEQAHTCFMEAGSAELGERWQLGLRIEMRRWVIDALVGRLGE